MRSPVAGVSYERDLRATIPGPDEEGAAPDRRSRPGVVDPVLPRTLEVLAGERVPRQDDVEEEKRQSGKRSRRATLTVFGSSGTTLRTYMRCRSSAGAYFRLTRSVKTKSEAVTGTPSLQCASGRIR